MHAIDAQILTALRAASGGHVSGSDLATPLGITRAAIWARIEELRSLGYEIDASPHQVYRLLSCPDDLHADDLLSRLGKTKVIGRDIRVFRETTSTNDVIEKLAADGVKEGVVVFAESQSKGRGRLGRRWVSPPARACGFPSSAPVAAVRGDPPDDRGVHRLVRAMIGVRIAPEIKWPSDILLRGQKVLDSDDGIERRVGSSSI